MLELSVMAGGVNTPHYRGYRFYKPDGHDYWLFMCFHTPFWIETDGVRREGGVGGCILQPPGAPLYHGPAKGMQEGFVNDWLYFNGADAAALIAQLELPVNEIFYMNDTAVIKRQMEQIIHELQRMLPEADLMQACRTAELLVELRRGLAAGSSGDESFRILSDVRGQMLSHAEEKWTLARMAGLSGYSVSRFTMLYRQYYDSSPTTDLIRARIAMARNLLMSGSESISCISEQCGFSSVQYFTRTYRALTGESPSQTRRGGA
ncbi:MAG: helix-turn-helix transcriptional regulator [Clostridia bacterium]|nr:helix-turn-helix transcriptional regulator [Clostridia bacterium]